MERKKALDFFFFLQESSMRRFFVLSRFALFKLSH